MRKTLAGTMLAFTLIILATASFSNAHKELMKWYVTSNDMLNLASENISSMRNLINRWDNLSNHSRCITALIEALRARDIKIILSHAFNFAGTTSSIEAVGQPITIDWDHGFYLLLSPIEGEEAYDQLLSSIANTLNDLQIAHNDYTPIMNQLNDMYMQVCPEELETEEQGKLNKRSKEFINSSGYAYSDQLRPVGFGN